MNKTFITATGTGIGKTFVTATLTQQLTSKGQAVSVVKPVITGWDDGENSDTAILLKACGLTVNPDNIANCSPWRFRTPLSVDMAAKREGQEVDFDKLVAFCNRPFSGIKLIEGAGGIMSPINSRKTFIDLAKILKCEIILVIGTYLGSISHTLTALEVLKGMDVRVIISESAHSPVRAEEMAQSIRQLIKTEITILPRCKNWQDAPDLI